MMSLKETQFASTTAWPCDPVVPGWPCEPVMPAGPWAPVIPVGPWGPVLPGGPVQASANSAITTHKSERFIRPASHLGVEPARPKRWIATPAHESCSLSSNTVRRQRSQHAERGEEPKDHGDHDHDI